MEEIKLSKATVLNLKDDDILVISVPGMLSEEAFGRLGDYVKSIIPPHVKVMIAENGIELSVLRKKIEEEKSVKTPPPKPERDCVKCYRDNVSPSAEL